MGLRLQRFCCCCNLRTGSLVIGTAGWLFTLLQIFAVSACFMDSDDSASEEMERRRQFRVWDVKGRTQYSRLFSEIGYALIGLIVCFLMVVGVYKKDKRYILPWLVLKCFEATVILIVSVVFFIIGIAHGDNALPMFLSSFLFAVVSAILFYLWLCVYSHYRDLGEGVAQDSIPNVYYAPPPATQPSLYTDETKLVHDVPPDYYCAVGPPAYEEKSKDLV